MQPKLHSFDMLRTDKEVNRKKAKNARPQTHREKACRGRPGVVFDYAGASGFYSLMIDDPSTCSGQVDN